MEDLDALRDQINSEAGNFREVINRWQEGLLEQIESAKQMAILDAIRDLGKRFSKLEERLVVLEDSTEES